jgi:tetratricopeptide (TPR) repeat protein
MNLDAWRCYARAYVHQLCRRPAGAITELRAALRHDPDFARATHRLAFLLAGQGHLTEALPLLERTVTLSPRNAGAWFNLGYAHDRSNDPARAVEAFSEAVRLSPRFDPAWFGLGRCLATLERLEEAIKAFEEAAKLEPMKGFAWYELGLLHHRRDEAERVRDIAMHLNRFDRHTARRLIRETGREDLAYLVEDLY